MEEEMVNQHAERDKMVFKFFSDAMDDINTIFAKNDKGQELIANRVQVATIFTFIDIVSSYWFEYQGRTGTQKERFIEWVERYCLIDENKDFTGSALKGCSSKELYAFRSSMVHFFGLSGNPEWGMFFLAPNDAEAEKISREFIKDQNKKGKKLYAVHSKELHSIVVEGSFIMLEEWREVIRRAQADESLKMEHIKGINRIHEKIMLEGAIKVPFEK